MNKLITLLIFSLFLSLNGFASALPSSPLKIGVSYQYRPYYFGLEKGIEIDLISQVLNRLKLDYSFHTFSLTRARHSLSSIKMDLIVTSIEDNEKGYCSDPYIYYSNVAVSLKKNKLTLNKISDFQGLKVATWQGANEVLGEEFLSIYPEQNLFYHELAQAENIPRLLLAKRVDVVVIDKFLFRYIWTELKKERGSVLEVTYHQVFPTRQYYCAMFQNEELKNAFNKELLLLKQKNFHRLIYQKYVPNITEEELKW
jgi:ABC-type amino acid transport substrate-binding protein